MPHEGQVIAEAWSIAHGRDEVGQDEPKVMQLPEVKIFRGTGTDYLVRDRVYHTLDGNDGKSISNMVREPLVKSENQLSQHDGCQRGRTFHVPIHGNIEQ